MDHIPSEKIPFIIGVVALALVFIGWLVYRNLKDEDEFEHNMDDPKKDIEKHSKEDKV